MTYTATLICLIAIVVITETRFTINQRSDKLEVQESEVFRVKRSLPDPHRNSFPKFVNVFRHTALKTCGCSSCGGCGGGCGGCAKKRAAQKRRNRARAARARNKAARDCGGSACGTDSGSSCAGGGGGSEVVININNGHDGGTHVGTDANGEGSHGADGSGSHVTEDVSVNGRNAKTGGNRNFRSVSGNTIHMKGKNQKKSSKIDGATKG